MKAITHFRVITPTGVNLDGFNNPNKKMAWSVIETKADADIAISQYGECPNGTEENKQYWKNQQAKCKIVRVTEITEEAVDSKINYSIASELLEVATRLLQNGRRLDKQVFIRPEDCNALNDIIKKATQ